MPETINVEHAGTSYTVLYLYKYLFKGKKKVKATFEKVDYSNKKDENFMYMRAKYICSMKLMSKSMESMSNEQETYIQQQNYLVQDYCQTSFSCASIVKLI